MINFLGQNLSWGGLIILFVASATIGMNKSGLHGFSLIGIPLFASVLGLKTSNAYVLLMLMIADAMAVIQYPLQKPKLLLRILPLAVLGLILGAVVGELLPLQGFKIMITAILVVLCILLVIPAKYKQFLQKNKIIGNCFGFLGGFTSMTGNIGGPVMITYLLSQNISKELYLSTYSWFFFSLDFFKAAALIFYWKTLTLQVAYFSPGLIPAMLVGFFAGVFIIKHINQNKFYILVTGLTLLSCAHLFYTMFHG